MPTTNNLPQTSISNNYLSNKTDLFYLAYFKSNSTSKSEQIFSYNSLTKELKININYKYNETKKITEEEEKYLKNLILANNFFNASTNNIPEPKKSNMEYGISVLIDDIFRVFYWEDSLKIPFGITNIINNLEQLKIKYFDKEN